MKKLIVITGIILITYLLLMTYVSQPAQAPVVSVQAEQVATEKEYKIGDYEGRVAVFRGGRLYLKTQTMLSSLPKSDRNRIENGIEFDSLKELKTLLQDYCS